MMGRVLLAFGIDGKGAEVDGGFWVQLFTEVRGALEVQGH